GLPRVNGADLLIDYFFGDGPLLICLNLLFGNVGSGTLVACRTGILCREHGRRKQKHQTAEHYLQHGLSPPVSLVREILSQVTPVAAIQLTGLQSGRDPRMEEPAPLKPKGAAPACYADWMHARKTAPAPSSL